MKPASTVEDAFLAEAMNTTVTMDALEFLAALPAGCVDLVVASPPYNPPKAWSAEKRRGFPDWLGRVAIGIARALAPHGVAALVLGSTRTPEKRLVPMDWILGPALDAAGVAHENRIVWPGRSAACGVGRLGISYEVVLIHAKGTPRTFRPGDGTARLDDWSDVERVAPGHRERTTHGDQFSEALVRRILETYSLESDLVMDCFSGSGTTQKACRDAKRRFVGCDVAHETLRNRRLGCSIA